MYWSCVRNATKIKWLHDNLGKQEIHSTESVVIPDRKKIENSEI